jgi:hypothetical protein
MIVLIVAVAVIVVGGVVVVGVRAMHSCAASLTPHANVGR